MENALHSSRGRVNPLPMPWAIFEKRTAADARVIGLDAHVQERSGATPWAKSDLVIEDLLVSAKMPQKVQVSFRLTKIDWDEAVNWARREGMTPAMLIGLAGRTLFVWDFEDVLQFLLERRKLRLQNKSLKRELKKLKSKLPIVVALLLSITPVLADSTFDGLVQERNALIQKVQSGQASDADVSRFQTVVQQIRDLTTARIQANTNRQNNLIQNLDRLDKQNAVLEQTLFGGVIVNAPAVSLTSQVNQTPNIAPNIASMVPPVPNIMGPPLRDMIDRMLLTALSKSVPMQQAIASEGKYSGTKQKIKDTILGLVDSLAPFRGFDDSMTVGDVILGENLKIKSVASAQYAQQKIVDETHFAIVVNTLQLAEGLGDSDLPRAEAAYKTLAELTCKSSADDLKALLDSHLQESIAANVKPDILAQEAQYQAYLKRALERDPVIHSIQEKVHKYNKKTKTEIRAAQIVPAVLGAARFAPYGVGISAGIAMGAFYSMTGGSELSKILKELYLDQSLQSRSELLMNEVRISLAAQKPDNRLLCWASQSLLTQ